MSAVLYTPEVLSLAIELARHPLTNDLPAHGEARSKSCGSTIALGLSVAENGSVESVGVRSQACAIGQASAAIFAAGAKGADAVRIRQTREAIVSWLRHEGALPDWPGLGVIAAAREYPARHGAVLLPWDAACSALDA